MAAPVTSTMPFCPLPPAASPPLSPRLGDARRVDARRDDVCRPDAAAVMFFPGRGRATGGAGSVGQRFDVDSVHHGPPTDAGGRHG